MRKIRDAISALEGKSLQSEEVESLEAEVESLQAKSAKLFADAISIASIWFRGRCILFLVDAVWPSSSGSERFLPDLQGILRGSPDKRIAISTRSRAIASNLGSHVDFGARGRQGPASVAMLMSYASPRIRLHVHDFEEVRGILGLCAGLPIALKVTGQAVAFRVASGLGFRRACRTYLEELSKDMRPGASFLVFAIRLFAPWRKNLPRRKLNRIFLSQICIQVCTSWKIKSLLLFKFSPVCGESARHQRIVFVSIFRAYHLPNCHPDRLEKGIRFMNITG